MLPIYKKSHPKRTALTAKSISSAVVRSYQPPASLIACALHTPAVPIKKKRRKYKLDEDSCQNHCKKCLSDFCYFVIMLISSLLHKTFVKNSIALLLSFVSTYFALAPF